jgi:hypothetical protein
MELRASAPVGTHGAASAGEGLPLSGAEGAPAPHDLIVIFQAEMGN